MLVGSIIYSLMLRSNGWMETFNIEKGSSERHFHRRGAEDTEVAQRKKPALSLRSPRLCGESAFRYALFTSQAERSNFDCATSVTQFHLQFSSDKNCDGRNVVWIPSN